MEVKIKEFFVCNDCQTNCPGGKNCVADMPDIFPRKQLIGCLGEYCDQPCKLQKEQSDLTISHLITLVKYLGKELNGYLIELKPT